MATTRYRCTACGNLTRFDVTVTRTTRAFHHYTVGGELDLEDVQVLAETVDEVSCRWCGHGREVEVVLDDGLSSSDVPPGETAGRPGADGGQAAAVG